MPPLPSDVYGLLLEVDVAQVEVDGLPAAEAGRVDELEERSVPNRQSIVAGDLVEDGVDLFRLRRFRQPSCVPGPGLPVGNSSRPQREAKESPNGCELPGDRRPGELPGISPGPVRAELGRVGAERGRVDTRKRAATSAEPRRELLDVDAIGAAGRVGEIRRRQKALYLGMVRHEPGFVLPTRLPALGAAS